jgi:argininosuccinate lyase
MPNLWSGRFEGEPDPDAFQFGVSFPFDRQLFEDDVTGSLAWVEALAKADALTAEDARTLDSGLRTILDKGLQDPSFVTGADEDVHAFVERRLTELVGQTGRRLHTGRSRNEQVSLDLRLYLRRRIPLLQQKIERLIEGQIEQAERAEDALMPSYTHLRRAMPVLVAHFFLAHVAALRRDHTRLAAAISEADALPLGSGAVAGTGYAIDTGLLARRLGFSRVVANSLDASSDRDFVSVFLHACALAMVHLSRFAEDLIMFSGEEFGFFSLADASSTGSSMMPQKKNPDPLELVRGKTGRAIGHLTGWLITLKGLPSGYNKDLQEDKEATFDAEATLTGALVATTAVVGALTLDRVVSARAASGLLLATDVADFLAARGLEFRTAHEVVGAMVRRLLVDGRDFTSLTLAEWRTFSERFDERILQMVTPQASVRGRRTPQSTHPDAVATALAEVKAWLADQMARRIKGVPSGA